MSASRPSNPRKVDYRPAVFAAGLGAVAGVSLALILFCNQLVVTGMARAAGLIMVLGAWAAGVSGGLMLQESRHRKAQSSEREDDLRPIWIAMGVGATAGSSLAFVVLRDRLVTEGMAPAIGLTMALGTGVAGWFGMQLLQDRRRSG